MKKGASPIIATVLLIGITITLASIILLWGNMFFVALSPPINCEEVNFQADIYNENNLDIVNNGNIDLYGFVIKEIGGGTVKILEEIILNEPIKSGHAYTKIVDFSGNILVVPIIKTEKEEVELSTCPDIFGVEISN